jgi:hypothetical protein
MKPQERLRIGGLILASLSLLGLSLYVNAGVIGTKELGVGEASTTTEAVATKDGNGGERGDQVVIQKRSTTTEETTEELVAQLLSKSKDGTISKQDSDEH